MWTGFARWLAGVSLACSAYTAVGLSAGACAGLIALSATEQVEVAWTAFLLAYLLPAGPLYWYFARAQTLRKRLLEFKALHDEGIITERQFQEFRKQAIRWHTERWFGRGAPEAGTEEGDPSKV